MEVERIAALFATLGTDQEAILLTGMGAIEEDVVEVLPKQVAAHFATHGLFQPERLRSMAEAARAELEREDASAQAHAHGPLRLAGHSPPLLSGLLLAGANTPPGPGRSDGVLTAEELAWLDLSQLDLVVLSACETGLGHPRSGEGMLGLRRTLRTGGVDTVVSSLWQVPDEPTATLMERFYQRRWQGEEGSLAALRGAQLELLRENRDRWDGDGRPQSWGAFVLTGDWR